MAKVKTGVIIAFSVALVIFFAGLILPYFLTDKLEKRLEREALIRSDSTWQMDIHNLKAGFWSRSISADSVWLKSSQQNLTQVRIGQVRLSRIQWLKLMLTKKPRFDVSITKLVMLLEKQLYRLHAGNLEIRQKDSTLRILDLELEPTLPAYEFSEARAKQIDRIELSIPELRVSGVNPDSFPDGVQNLDSLIVTNARLFVFRNKQVPRAGPERAKPLANDMAKALPLPLSLKSASIRDALIIYSEHHPDADTAAHVSFNHLHADIHNFASAEHPLFKADSMKLDITTRFMNAARLHVEIVYPLFDPYDEHYIRAELDSINPKAAQDMLLYAGFLRINSGMVHNLQAEITLNDSAATGTVKLMYSDLDIALASKQHPDTKGIKEFLTDIFTDYFLIEKDNTADDPRIGEIHFEREKEKSIFAYWWKALLSGIKSSIKTKE